MKQHRTPCAACPFRKAPKMPGYLGGVLPAVFIDMAHDEQEMPCHTKGGRDGIDYSNPTGPQCAGRAIYQANVCKSPRNKLLLRLPSDRELIVSTPMEFLNAHKLKDTR